MLSISPTNSVLSLKFGNNIKTKEDIFQTESSLKEKTEKDEKILVGLGLNPSAMSTEAMVIAKLREKDSVPVSVDNADKIEPEVREVYRDDVIKTRLFRIETTSDGVERKTKYGYDGERRLWSNEIAPDGSTRFKQYRFGGELLDSVVETTPNGSVKILAYREDGKTLDFKNDITSNGYVKKTLYAENGITKTHLIERFPDGSSREIEYKDDGMAPRSLRETNPDNSIKTKLTFKKY